MNANERLGLPRDKMKKVVIAIDVDGTLRCNCTDTCEDPNTRIVCMTNAFVSMKNTKIIIWSGGGKAYAQRFIDKYFTPKIALKITSAGKLDSPRLQPDIAIDDIQDTALGSINLIVNEK